MLTNKRKIFILLNIFIWMFFGILTLVGSMPRTPLMIDEDIKTYISIVYPNRWPFFTKNPRENYFYILQKESEGYIPHPHLPNSSFANFYGIINYQKAISLEYGMISRQVDEDLWSTNNTGQSLSKIVDNDTIKTIRVKKEVRFTELEGEYIFAKIEPLPYLWRDKINQLQMPSKFVKIVIE